MSMLSRCTLHTGAIAALRTLLILGVAACGGDSGDRSGVEPPPPVTTGSVAGIVTSAGTPVAGAVVGIGSNTVTTGADGRYRLDNVPGGSATLRCSKAGFEDYAANVTVSTGVTTHDIPLVVQPLPTGSVAGLVTSGGTPIAGAVVGIGPDTTTTGADGLFRLDDVPSGVANLTCRKAGYDDYTAVVTVGTGVTTHNIGLFVREIYTVGAFSIFVPASVAAPRGVIMAFGGPDTRCFADAGIPCLPVTIPNPELESALQQLGARYRALAVSSGLAVAGRTSVAGVPDDDAVFEALATTAGLSGRAELVDAPFLVHGQSAGGPVAYGIMTRHPTRAVGLVLRVSAEFTPSDPAGSFAVPALVITAGEDPDRNEFNRNTYNLHRSAGGLWAYAEEPGVPRMSMSPGTSDLIVNWVATALAQRLPASPGTPLRPLVESAGWLADPVTFDIASWTEFAGDRRSASWLPSEGTAQRWRAVVRSASGPGSTPGSGSAGGGGLR